MIYRIFSLEESYLAGSLVVAEHFLTDFLFVRRLRRPTGVDLIIFENPIGNDVARILMQRNRKRFIPRKRRDAVLTSMVPIDLAWITFSPDGKTWHLKTTGNIGIHLRQVML
jgi:hypothetical protein